MPIQPVHRLSLPVSRIQHEPRWKSRSLSESGPMERRGPSSTKVKRWDGAARSCSSWDSLRRDPELWFRGGNCFVHLYGQGQSQRGPAFKVPFGALLAASCHPLLQRSISREKSQRNGLGLDEFEDLDEWYERNPTKRVDLYIPAPPTQDKTDAFNYHLATRNFFAWVFRRSLVAEHLGNALIALLNTMADFRNDDEDHAADLLDYMDEEGYLGVDEYPNHALAVLHFAEVHRIKDAYIHAFCHCVGMSEHLPPSPEYYYISPGSKRLIRHNRLEMDLRINRAGKMLRSFLEDEMCEPFVSLPPGGRAHLDRFRSFLFSFYSSKFGYYPPQSVDGRDSMFEPRVFQIMHEDFRALYEFLVDETTTSGDDISAKAFGGVSVIQNVLAFDSRRRYMTLDHPFPLLPEVLSSPTSKRQTWLFRADKLTPDQRLIAYAALVRATNMRLGVLDNDLVRAYRKFEELSVAPATKVDRNEKIGVADARKVRWILIYGIYQVLRHATEIPVEVSDTDVDYNLAVSIHNLPPWKEEEPQQAPPSEPYTPVLSQVVFNEPIQQSPQIDEGLEIRPDIDYLAMIRRAEETPQSPQLPHYSWSIVGGTSSSRSTKSTSHSISTFPRSLNFLRRSEPPSATDTESSRRSSMYHEIMISGYGNGTHPVKKASVAPRLPEIDTAALAAAFRPVSVASSKSYTSSVYSDASSHMSSEGTADSSLPSSSPKTSSAEPVKIAPQETSPPILSPIPIRSRRREVMSMVSSSELVHRRPSTSAGSERRATVNNYAREYQDLVREERDRAEMCPEPLLIRKTMSVRLSSAPREGYVKSMAAREEDDDGLIWKCSGLERCKSVAARSATWA